MRKPKDRGRCPTCGGQRKEYRHSLNEPLIVALGKLYHVGGIGNSGDLFNTNSNVRNNFQKLQYWGLILPVDLAGTWKLTGRGEKFLLGRCCIPRSVITYKGDLRAYSKDDKVNISVMLPGGYKRREDYLADHKKVFEHE